MKRNSIKIYSGIVLAAYLAMLALPVWHFHPIYFDANSRFAASQNSSSYFDPFQSANSECSITQLAATSYINDIVFTHNNNLSSYNLDYNSTVESNKQLQLYFVSNGLRAPPIHS